MNVASAQIAAQTGRARRSKLTRAVFVALMRVGHVPDINSRHVAINFPLMFVNYQISLLEAPDRVAPIKIFGESINPLRPWTPLRLLYFR